MHLQIVMDSNGDTRHEFDPADLSSLATAQARIHELTGKGFRAVALGQDGAASRLVALPLGREVERVECLDFDAHRPTKVRGRNTALDDVAPGGSWTFSEPRRAYLRMFCAAASA